MRVLFDQNVPRQLRLHLRGHSVMTAAQMGWDRIENGSLLRVAEETGFEVLITGDQNIYYQQNNAVRAISLIVLSATKRKAVVQSGAEIALAVARAVPGSFETVMIGGTERKMGRGPSKI